MKKKITLEKLSVQSFSTSSMRFISGGGTDETRCPPCTDDGTDKTTNEVYRCEKTEVGEFA